MWLVSPTRVEPRRRHGAQCNDLSTRLRAGLLNSGIHRNGKGVLDDETFYRTGRAFVST